MEEKRKRLKEDRDKFDEEQDVRDKRYFLLF